MGDAHENMTRITVGSEIGFGHAAPTIGWVKLRTMRGRAVINFRMDGFTWLG